MIETSTVGIILERLNNIENVLDSSMGNAGGVYSGAATITPDTGYVFNAILVVTDTVITCVGNITGLTSITFEAGSVIPGRFTSITIASGTIIAYQGV
jgi:hypothetical protein